MTAAASLSRASGNRSFCRLRPSTSATRSPLSLTAGPAPGGLAVVDQAKIDFGVPQCQTGQAVADMSHFRLDGFEKFTSGGGVEEQVLDRHHGAGRRTGFADVQNAAPLHPDLGTGGPVGRA